MSEFFPESQETRIPLIDRRRQWILGVCSLFILAAVTALMTFTFIESGWSRPFSLVLHGILCLFFVPFSGQCLFLLLRYGRTKLVIDREGIWLEGRRRQGLRWEDISGYELPRKLMAPAVRIHGRSGQTLNIPLIFGPAEAGHLGMVSRELDRCLGPDGDRPPLKVPTNALDARLHHHYGAIPPVEMEPDVVYRYIDPKKLGDEATRRISLAVPLISIILPSFGVASRFGLPLWIVFVAALASTIGFAVITTRNLMLAQGFQDRFIRRGDEVWRIRRGREMRLPPAISAAAPPILGHPTTAYGKGFFAYRIAPQFLEPDV